MKITYDTETRRYDVAITGDDRAMIQLIDALQLGGDALGGARDRSGAVLLRFCRDLCDGTHLVVGPEIAPTKRESGL